MKKETNKAVIPTQRGMLINDGTDNGVSINVAMTVNFLNESLKASLTNKDDSTLISIEKAGNGSGSTLQDLINELKGDNKTNLIGSTLESVIGLFAPLDLDISTINVLIEKFHLEYEKFNTPKNGANLTYDIKVNLKSSGNEIVKLGPIKLIDISVAISSNGENNVPQITIAN